MSLELEPPGFEGGDEVIRDPVADRFVKGSLVPVGPEIELEALQLHAELIGDVTDLDPGEIGLAGPRTEAGELRAIQMDFIGAIWIGIWKNLQFLVRFRRHRR